VSRIRPFSPPRTIQDSRSTGASLLYRKTSVVSPPKSSRKASPQYTAPYWRRGSTDNRDSLRGRRESDRSSDNGGIRSPPGAPAGTMPGRRLGDGVNGNLLAFLNASVEALDLEDMAGLDHATLKLVGRTCASLRSLNLHGQRVTNELLQSLAMGCPHLEELDVGGQRCGTLSLSAACGGGGGGGGGEARPLERAGPLAMACPLARGAR
jgi:hypothetical protein